MVVIEEFREEKNEDLERRREKFMINHYNYYYYYFSLRNEDIDLNGDVFDDADSSILSSFLYFNFLFLLSAKIR